MQLTLAEASLLTGDAGEVDARSDQRADDVGVERHAELVDAIFDRVVVRREVLVGEALADEHGLVAVVQEAGVVAAALDGTVVRVDGLQVETVLGDGANHRDSQDVAAVLVHVVVDVELVLVGAAVADHVALQHRDDVILGGSALVGVLDAAPEPLLFSGKVEEAELGVIRNGEVFVGLGHLEDGDRAGSIVVGARGNLLVAPGVARGRIQM